MSPQIREQLANLCYAAALAVIGGVMLAAGGANEENAGAEVVALLGGVCLFGAVLYAVFGLVRLAAILRQPDD